MNRVRAMDASGCRKAPGGSRTLPWVLAILLVSQPWRTAGAQLTVDRLSMVLTLTPGESRLGVLTIRNDHDRSIQAMIRLEDWNRDQDGTNQWHPLGSVEGSCGSSLAVFPATVNLPPGGTQAIRISIDSTYRPERECWAAAIVETAPTPPGKEGGVVHRIRTATKIYVQPPGVVAVGEVESLRVGIMRIGADSVRAVELTVANTGGRHLEAAGELQIRTPDNAVLQTLKLPTAYVLGGARVRVRALFPDLPPGRYVLLAILDYGGAEFAAGQSEYNVP